MESQVMNIYAIIILSTLVVNYILELVADFLNLQALRPDLPKEFEGIYDAEVYRKSQEYTRVRTAFGMFSSTLGLAITLLFWFAGGFNVVDRVVRGWELGSIGTGLAYIGILALGKALLSLPFRVYTTFVIEARFGFNRTSPTTFLTDILKGLVLAVGLGGPLLVAVLAFFEYAGTYAWVYGWVATTLCALGIQYIAPTWIMPLFNTFQPLADGELKDAILAYTRRIHFPLAGIYTMDGSRRSSKSNAFFTGFGKHKRIVLFDTLIAQHPVSELVAILAHEIGHYQKKHMLQHMVISIVHLGVMFFLLSMFLSHQGLFQAFFMDHPSVYAGLIFFSLLYTPIESLLAMLLQILSRKHEYEADHFAAETIDNSETLVQTLQKLSVHNLSNLTPHPLSVFLHYSHPPVLQRIKAIRRIGGS
jgi:STE24 endopeptidase